MSWYARSARKVAPPRRGESVVKMDAGLFWQIARPEPGSSFYYRGTEYCVDSVQADPACGYQVSAHPSAVIGQEVEP